MTPRRGWPHIVVASTALLGLLLLVDAPAAIRAPVAAWFLLLCPGVTIAAPLAPPSRSTTLALAVVLSVAIGTIAATALLLAGALTATSAFLALAAICLGGCAPQIKTARRPRGRAEPVDHHARLIER